MTFSATACPPGHWSVEGVMSLPVWTQRRLGCFPSPPQSPLLTFPSTQDLQKPGASSHRSVAHLEGCWEFESNKLLIWGSCIFKQECNVFVQPDFRSTSQSMTVTGMMSVGLSLPSLSLSIIQVGLYLILENLILDHWYIWQNVPLIATVCAFTDWLKRRPVNNKNNTN